MIILLHGQLQLVLPAETKGRHILNCVLGYVTRKVKIAFAAAATPAPSLIGSSYKTNWISPTTAKFNGA